MTYHTGDTKPDLSGVLTSGDAPVVLTGATLAVHVEQPDGVVLTMTGTPGASGAWSAPWPGPIAQAGRHLVEVEVTYAGGGKQTFGPHPLYVNQQIA